MKIWNKVKTVKERACIEKRTSFRPTGIICQGKAVVRHPDMLINKYPTFFWQIDIIFNITNLIRSILITVLPLYI
jgi:hypothetical protein